MTELKIKTKDKLNKTAVWIKGITAWFDRHPVTFITCLSLFMTLVIEILCRRSVVDGFVFMVLNPLIFLANASILFFMYSLSLLLKKRYSIILVVTVIWFGLAVADFITTAYRVTPISFNDILILPSVFSIINIYLSIIELTAVGIAAVAAITVIIIAIIKQKKRGVAYLKAGITSAVSALLTAVILVSSMNSDTVAKGFSFIGNGYKQYGFVFSFCLSALDRGIDEPENYGEEAMSEVEDEIGKIDTNEVTPDVNIIMLQLESFIDVNRLNNVTFSENPVPYFTYLKENYPHAFVSVPALGAGTANTEFEVITQMNVDFFGIGEVPYKSVMQSTSCETVNYDLKELGYACHAIHNHEGTFYDRNIVYSDLGFDTFTSVEYMQNVKTNPLGWAKDYILTSEIMKSLDSTKGLDYIYTISVQGHGKYPDEVVDPDQPIKVTSGMEDSLIGFEYYVNQIHEMDKFLEQLTTALSQYDEKVILVLYGDHFPSFQISDENLSSGDVFQTEYVIWSNYGLEAEAEDLQAYQLSSYIMSILGCNNGFLTKYHQNFSGSENYLDKLDDIQYDMLYGNNYVTSGTNPYAPTELQMGTEKITVTKVEVIGDAAFITGNDFTKWSVVNVNGEAVDTVFVNSSTLFILAENLSPDYSVTVSQVGDNKKVLSETDPYVGSLG